MPDDLERAGALIVNKSMSHCLMVHQKRSQLWGVPKGRKDFKEETFEDCMRREIKEEVDLKINEIPHDVLDVMSIYSKTKIYLIQLKSDDLFECHAPLEDGKENHEIDVVEWVPVEEALARKTNSITKRSLRRLARRLGMNIVNMPRINHPSYDDQMKNYDDILKHAYATESGESETE